MVLHGALVTLSLQNARGKFFKRGAQRDEMGGATTDVPVCPAFLFAPPRNCASYVWCFDWCRHLIGANQQVIAGTW